MRRLPTRLLLLRLRYVTWGVSVYALLFSFRAAFMVPMNEHQVLHESQRQSESDTFETVRYLKSRTEVEKALRGWKARVYDNRGRVNKIMYLSPHRQCRRDWDCSGFYPQFILVSYNEQGKVRMVSIDD